MNYPLISIFTALLLWAATHATVAGQPFHPGEKNIDLVRADGRHLTIGSVHFEQENDGLSFKVALDERVFDDYFLSMRPFKCIEAGREHFCHQPYPYQLKRVINHNDLAALEYDLMFIFKTPEQYNSVDAWNGLYYKLAFSGDTISGSLHAVDLNLIMAPPEAGVEFPIKPTDLTLLEPGSHEYYQLIIR